MCSLCDLMTFSSSGANCFPFLSVNNEYSNNAAAALFVVSISLASTVSSIAVKSKLLKLPSVNNCHKGLFPQAIFRNKYILIASIWASRILFCV